MPNNCSTLIQRKQHILHKILRSNSEGKLQNAVAETTSELRVAGTRKVAGYSSSSNQLPAGSTGPTHIRRTNLFTTNRIQPTVDRIYETRLPSIRDTNDAIDRQKLLYNDIHARSRPKTPLVGTSPKNTARPPSASISSLFNTLAKRSTDNFMSSNGELDELHTPHSRLSRRPSNESNKYGNGTNHTPTKSTLTPLKHSGDSGVDSRYSNSPPEMIYQQRVSNLSNRARTSAPNVQVDSPLGHETTTTGTTTPKERTNNGQLYQRRMNNNIKTPTKQKIDKFRRRSEEVTQGMNGNTLINAANAGLSATTPALPTRPRPPPSTPTPVRRVTSDAEIQARLEVLRLSMESNTIQADQQQNIRNRLKSPYLYSTHQQLAPSGAPHTSSVFRRGQPIPTLNQNQNQNRHTPGANYRRQQQQQQQLQQQPIKNNQGSLYLAFIASRHLSTLEDTLFECDIDQPKLLRIFSWLKNVEEHRHEQLDHDKLLIEQNQRMINQEDDLSLYSEIQYAVDDLPPNTSGKPCEKLLQCNLKIKSNELDFGIF